MTAVFQIVLALLLMMYLSFPATAQDKREADVEVEKVTVTATLSEVPVKDAPGAVTIITAEEIKDVAANDILDIVRDTAGVSLIGRSVGGRAVMSIRGFDSRHSLIMVDGKRVSASDPVFGHSDFEQNWVPIESIERIEVVRGPMSALYGSEAMGGVINIITKSPTKEWSVGAKIGGGVKAEGDGGGNQSYAAQVAGPIVKDKFGFGISGEYIRDEDTPDRDEPKYSELEGKEVLTGGAKLTYTPTENHKVEADINLTTDDRWQDTSSRGTDYEGLYELDKAIYSLRWQGIVGPTSSTVTAYRSDIDKNSIKEYEDGSRSDYPESLINNVLEGHTSFGIATQMLTLGGELREEELESTTIVQGEDSVVHGALYVQDEWPLFSDRLLLTLGLRWDDHEDFGSETSPRIYAVTKITDKLNLKTGYGHAFVAPTIKQVSEGYYAANGPHEFYGNPDVKPETTDSYEAGLEYFSDKIFARAIYFYNDIEDLIDWEMIGRGDRGNMYMATNIAEAQTQGVETELGVVFPYGFDLSANYTYLDAKDTGNDVRLDGKPRHTANVKLKYTFDAWGISTNLRWQFIGGQVLYNDDDELEDVPDYSLWYFSIRKQFFEHTELQLGVDNIGDVRLAEESDLFAYEERGRFYYANLRIFF